MALAVQLATLRAKIAQFQLGLGGDAVRRHLCPGPTGIHLAGVQRAIEIVRCPADIGRAETVADSGRTAEIAHLHLGVMIDPLPQEVEPPARLAAPRTAVFIQYLSVGVGHRAIHVHIARNGQYHQRTLRRNMAVVHWVFKEVLHGIDAGKHLQPPQIHLVRAVGTLEDLGGFCTRKAAVGQIAAAAHIPNFIHVLVGRRDAVEVGGQRLVCHQQAERALDTVGIAGVCGVRAERYHASLAIYKGDAGVVKGHIQIGHHGGGILIQIFSVCACPCQGGVHTRVETAAAAGRDRHSVKGVVLAEICLGNPLVFGNGLLGSLTLCLVLVLPAGAGVLVDYAKGGVAIAQGSHRGGQPLHMDGIGVGALSIGGGNGKGNGGKGIGVGIGSLIHLGQRNIRHRPLTSGRGCHAVVGAVHLSPVVELGCGSDGSIVLFLLPVPATGVDVVGKVGLHVPVDSVEHGRCHNGTVSLAVHMIVVVGLKGLQCDGQPLLFLRNAQP